MQDLNPRQREAARYVDGPLLVLAGAGSGKTRVIIHKIAHLIGATGLEARRVRAVTFTNKAAREMRERVSRLLPTGQGRGLRISTFHTLGLEFLRREHAQTGLRPGFSIFTEADVDQLLGDLTRSDPLERAALRGLRARISAWKDARCSPEQALAESDDATTARDARIYAAYQRSLAAFNGVDFDDLILAPVRLLSACESTRLRWQARIGHLLVDEYQDTNAAQYALIKLLIGGHGRLTAVGDDDQSIYAWRGARPENLAQLADDFPALKVVKLEQNYRSTGRILRGANAVISHNSHLFEKRLWSELGAGDMIRVVPCDDEEREAEQVVSEIVHNRFQKGTDYGEYAILYRGNHQSRPFEKALRAHRIPYTLSGGTAFFDQPEIRDLLAYLRLIANPDDDAALLRAINVPRRGIGAGTLEQLAGVAAAGSMSLFDAIGSPELDTRLRPAAVNRLTEFGDWVQTLQRLADGEPPSRVLSQLISDVDYRDWLAETSASDQAAARRGDNVDELIAWLRRLESDPEDDATDLAGVIGHLSLVDMLQRQDDATASGCVQLMTLHAAKGLEFPHVFLTGVEETLLPHRSSIDSGDIEEERRLLYVGITRAQRTLTLTYANRRQRGGEAAEREPSRFLDELPAADLEWLGRDRDLSEQEQRERGFAHLDRLKTLLAES